MRRRVVLEAISLLILLFTVCPQARAGWIENGVPVCSAYFYQLSPAIVPDGAGGAIISWFDCRISSSESNIYAQRIDAMGRALWAPDGIPVCAARERQVVPIMGSDGLGGAVVAWIDFRLGNCDIFAQRIGPNGEMRWEENGSVVTIMKGHQFEPRPVLIPDGAGGAIIAWTDQDESRQTDIFAQRMGGESGNQLWHSYGMPVCVASGYQTEPVITTDGASGAIVGWVDRRSEVGYSDLFAQRINASGLRLWLGNGSPVCQTFGDQLGLAVVTDNCGGAIFVWFDYRESSYDIYASRIDANGRPMWAVNGIPITALPGQQRYPIICSDGAAGAIIAWVDYRGPDTDIFAQRVDAGGNLLWPAEGVPISYFEADQGEPAIVADGQGGAIVSWIDYRDDGYSSIYAQRVSADGAILWAPYGVKVCRTPKGKYANRIASDGNLGAIVSWADDREGPTDIFAQRVRFDGTLVSTWLLSWAAAPDGADIRLSWKLGDAGDDVEFVILRGDGEEPPCVEIAGSVERNGLSCSFVDRTVDPAGVYRYRVDAMEGGSRRTLFETGPVTAPAPPLALHQNHPNPFNPSTEIRFYLPERARVSLAVFDVRGNLVRTLREGILERGDHTAAWDGRDERGEQAASGVYFCRLAAGKDIRTRKMVLMR